MKRYYFHCTCVSSGDGAAIHAMIDKARDISRKTFLRYVDRENMREVEAALGYAGHPKQGLTMAGDFHPSYHRSAFRGEPCIYFVWSAIEHIFLPDCAA